jgi:hypothetical protein
LVCKLMRMMTPLYQFEKFDTHLIVLCRGCSTHSQCNYTGVGDARKKKVLQKVRGHGAKKGRQHIQYITI